MLRGHQPVVLTNFKGLWQRGDPENTPLDHFESCNNIKHIGNNFGTRDGIGVSQNVAVPLNNILRIYNYPTNTANTLIVLCLNDDGITGDIYHFVDADTVYGPVLSVEGMFDFAFVPYAGRAYISPFKTFQTGEINIQKGLEDEILYVYAGDGTNARAAAGTAPNATALTIANGAAGHTDPGYHLFGVVGETDSGYLSPPVALTNFTTAAASSVSFGNFPIFSGTQWVRRHLVATKVIASYNGNPEGYDYFYVPDAVVEDNTGLALNNISFYDIDLLENASHLFDNYSSIPAGCSLNIFNDRLVLTTTFDDINLILVSASGEPEAISQIDGVIEYPPDGNPITCTQDLRNVLYVFKRSKTGGYVDTGEEPSNWELSPIDNAMGCPVHGIATVLDSGSTNVDFMIIATFAGIVLFNGKYILPELSYKVQQLWQDQDQNLFRNIQLVNAPIQKWLLVILPDHRVLCGNYSDGLDPKSIEWEPWSYEMAVNCIAIWNISQIVIGSSYNG